MVGLYFSRFKFLKFLFFVAYCIWALAAPPALALDLLGYESNSGADLFLRKIPTDIVPKSASTYHQIPFDFSDSRSKEKLVKIEDYGIPSESFYARTDGLNAPYYRCLCKSNGTIYARKTVAEKLSLANKALLPYGYELLVLDAHRPVSCQKELWSYFVARAKEVMPNPTEAECIEFAGRYCSDPRKFNPDDWQTWPTHSTGGAVDLTMRRKKTGELAFMGGIFDDASPLSSTIFYENRPESEMSASDLEARRNRRLLFWAMNSAGFGNYQNEWWHYDFGTQMWAKKLSRINPKLGSLKAFYGTMSAPSK